MIDDKDRKILNILLDNSRLSYRQVAKKAGMSVATVMARVKELESSGILKKYTAAVDYDMLDYDMHVLIEIRVAKGKLFQVEKKVAAHPNVESVFDTTGHFDAAVIARFKNRRSMDNFLKQIQTYDFVERTETKLILNTIKDSQIKV